MQKTATLLAAVLALSGCAGPQKTETATIRPKAPRAADTPALNQEDPLGRECAQRHIDWLEGRTRASEPNLIAKQVADERCRQWYDKNSKR